MGGPTRALLKILRAPMILMALLLYVPTFGLTLTFFRQLSGAKVEYTSSAFWIAVCVMFANALLRGGLALANRKKLSPYASAEEKAKEIEETKTLADGTLTQWAFLVHAAVKWIWVTLFIWFGGINSTNNMASSVGTFIVMLAFMLVYDVIDKTLCYVRLWVVPVTKLIPSLLISMYNSLFLMVYAWAFGFMTALFYTIFAVGIEALFLYLIELALDAEKAEKTLTGLRDLLRKE